VIAVTADASLIGGPKCFVAENQNNKQYCETKRHCSTEKMILCTGNKGMISF